LQLGLLQARLGPAFRAVHDARGAALRLGSQTGVQQAKSGGRGCGRERCSQGDENVRHGAPRRQWRGRGPSIDRRGTWPEEGSEHAETPLGREEGNYLNLDYQWGTLAFASGIPAKGDAHDEWTQAPVQIVLAQKYRSSTHLAGSGPMVPPRPLLVKTRATQGPSPLPVMRPRNSARACR